MADEETVPDWFDPVRENSSRGNTCASVSDIIVRSKFNCLLFNCLLIIIII